MASALNKLASGIDSKMEGLSKQIQDKIDPIWRAVFEEDGLRDKVEKLDTEVFEEDVGLKAKIQALEQAANEYEGKFQELKNENVQLRRELQTFKGIAQHQQDQIVNVKEDIVHLTARSMAKNITVSGLKEEKNENCRAIVFEFLHEVLKAPIDEISEIKDGSPYGYFQSSKQFSMNDGSKMHSGC